MELLFLYIREYKNLKRLNLNFGSEYYFNFNEESKQLKIEENELFISDFYNQPGTNVSITNITSIIGENGTGKSNILAFLKKNFLRGRNLYEDCVFITKSEKEIQVYSTFKNVELSNLYKSDHNFKLKEIEDDSPPNINFGFDFKGFPDFDVVFLSNVFDGSDNERAVNGLYDISTNGLLKSDYARLLGQGTITSKENPIELFKTEEIFRQLKFIHSDINKDILPFKLPDELFITPYEYFYKPFQEDHPFYSISSKISSFIQGNLDFSAMENTTPLILVVLNNLLLELDSLPVEEAFKRRLADMDFIYNEDRSIYYNKSLNTFSENLIKNCESWLNEVGYEIPDALQLIKNIIEFIEFLFKNNDILRHSLTGYMLDDVSPITFIDFDLDYEKKESFIKSFLQHYLKTFRVNPYLKFKWRNLSSGENALLNLYSRLYSLSDREKSVYKIKNNVLLLIDEGDIYLHPSWQKEMVKSILKVLPQIFKSSRGKRNIQIILTTNSPIPASDLLNYNTIFLKKESVGEKNKTIVIDNLEDQHETFAANVHNLLSNSFFVNDGLIGNFAKDKINDLIYKLKSLKEFSIKEREDIRKLIHQIGEPVIKNKLMQIYNDRFNLSFHERLDNIEKRLDND